MTRDEGLSTPQPAPATNASRPLWELVQEDAAIRFGFERGVDLLLRDMRERDAFGRAKYGTPLQAWNGRDALVDAYQEALDLCVYLRQQLAERAAPDDSDRDLYLSALDMAFDLRQRVGL